MLRTTPSSYEASFLKKEERIVKIFTGIFTAATFKLWEWDSTSWYVHTACLQILHCITRTCNILLHSVKKLLSRSAIYCFVKELTIDTIVWYIFYYDLCTSVTIISFARALNNLIFITDRFIHKSQLSLHFVIFSINTKVVSTCSHRLTFLNVKMGCEMRRYS